MKSRLNKNVATNTYPNGLRHRGQPHPEHPHSDTSSKSSDEGHCHNPIFDHFILIIIIIILFTENDKKMMIMMKKQVK